MKNKKNKTQPKKKVTRSTSINTLNLVKMMNEQDQKVAAHVGKKNVEIAKAIDLCVTAINKKGRVIYVGAGTPGKLAFLDASEIYPTYEAKNWIQAIIAGGNKVLKGTVEKIESSKTEAIKDLTNIKLSAKDIVIGISSSGSTPYTVSAIKYAKKTSSKTIVITTTPNSTITKEANIVIDPIVGTEIILGSTRMKSGSAQKFILNMISTGIMLKMGKIKENPLFNKKPAKSKLLKYSIQVLANITSLTENKAELLFNKAGKNVQVAIIMHYLKTNKKKSQNLLKEYSNSVKLVFEDKQNKLTKSQKLDGKKANIRFDTTNILMKVNYIRLLTSTKKVISKNGNKIQKKAKLKFKSIKKIFKNSLEKKKKSKRKIVKNK